MPEEAGVGFVDVGCGFPGTQSNQFSSEVWARPLAPLKEPHAPPNRRAKERCEDQASLSQVPYAFGRAQLCPSTGGGWVGRGFLQPPRRAHAACVRVHWLHLRGLRRAECRRVHR